MSLPEIESYRSYREYLRDYFAAKKVADRRFSHRAFAAKAGFTSTALVPLLIQGKRNLTARYLPGFVRALGLDPRRAAYLMVLADFTHARSDEDRRHLESELEKHRAKGPSRVDAARKRFYESWIHVALHQALSCLDIGEDLSPVRNFLRPEPSLEDLKQSFSVLKSLRLVREDEHGHWRPSEANLLTDTTIGPWVVRGFRDQMIDLGRTAHERFAPGRRRSATETLALSTRAAERVRERLDIFRQEIVGIALSDPEPAQEVLQLNLLLFPLSIEPQP
jgi:uncharacterized protein (TIGR02147 family)